MSGRPRWVRRRRAERRIESSGPWDAGLQPERTTLSWIRTALTMAVVSLLTARLAWQWGVVALVVALVGTLAASALVSVQSRRHYRRDRRLRAGVAVEPALPAVLGLTVLVVSFAGVSLALVALPGLRG